MKSVQLLTISSNEVAWSSVSVTDSKPCQIRSLPYGTLKMQSSNIQPLSGLWCQPTRGYGNTDCHHESTVVASRGRQISMLFPNGEGSLSWQLRNLWWAVTMVKSQYVIDFEGKPSMDSKYNPNGSVNAIEGITSKNGQIIGKMGHQERSKTVSSFRKYSRHKDQHLLHQRLNTLLENKKVYKMTYEVKSLNEECGILGSGDTQMLQNRLTSDYTVFTVVKKGWGSFEWWVS